MKKLKFVKTFESFKVNEEVPYNFDISSELVSVKWNEEEISDLNKLGADKVGTDSATFYLPETRRGDKVSIRKALDDNGQIVFRASSSGATGDNTYRKTNYLSESNWKMFIKKLDEFMKNEYNR